MLAWGSYWAVVTPEGPAADMAGTFRFVPHSSRVRRVPEPLDASWAVEADECVGTEIRLAVFVFRYQRLRVFRGVGVPVPPPFGALHAVGPPASPDARRPFPLRSKIRGDSRGWPGRSFPRGSYPMGGVRWAVLSLVRYQGGIGFDGRHF